ncbi:unnamed protein product [Zymoseptoria tritici ST99CH_1E4]|uniref:DUF8035 domain-containing protein n=1 Tax=Zymoseptoria tritici ST99CH_1E4 TaxID=1276532 RepID=A0A2H1GGL9_ZYMTR|nr:unnamed protein product [Zymoseptoria tritici ST99CH_1E4]
MSRYRASDADLAYGDIPQRWDRERFERFGSRGGPPPRFEEDYHYEERERPGRRDVAVADREISRGPGGRFEERDRYYEEDIRARAASHRRRRTDRELFGDIDPREVAEMALTPYQHRGSARDELDVMQRPPRPGILRRQSSLDTFDRRPVRQMEREDYRIPAYTPVPLPVPRRHREWAEPEDYREVEIQRERTVRRRRGHKHKHKEQSRAPSSSSSSSSSSSREDVKSRGASTKAPRSAKAPSMYESTHETVTKETKETKEAPPPPPPAPAPSNHSSSIEASVRQERRFKKGKTRMPKRLVRVEAIMDLGYPFDEEEDFYVLRIALEKDQIDEVIKISETYKDGEKKKVYRFEKTVEEEAAVPPPPVGEREEIERTEWINPPTVLMGGRAKSVRDASPSAKSSISRRGSPRNRRPSSPGTYVERQTIYEQNLAPPAPPPIPAPAEYYEERIVEERAPSSHRHRSASHGGALVVQERSDYRSDRDINQEIRALESERRALKLEREAEEKREMALRLRERPAEEFQMVEYREPRRGEELVIYEREREKSPVRNVIRVEKDRKAKQKAKIVAAAMATLT